VSRSELHVQADKLTHFTDGVFSDGAVPGYDGVESYIEAGGIVSHSSGFLQLEDARGKDIVVVGYGKSAIDVAVAVSDVAKSTTVVARKLIWKLPRYLNNVLPVCTCDNTPPGAVR
jgi:cation diffusion facilitator CzcD-associated flavoprotein CzcO